MPKIVRRSKKEKKIVFIDRDGVINADRIGDYVTRWEDFHFLRGVLPGLKRLTKAGYGIIIISNQAGIGDGKYSKRALDLITRRMLAVMKRSRIRVRGVYYCLHGKRAGCRCRKPKTGLFKTASRHLRYDKKKTFFIGDKKSDVIAGKRFGLKTIFVLTGHGRNHYAKLGRRAKPDLIAAHFSSAVKQLLQFNF